MKWIGITGGIASGKSTVSNLLRELGFPVIDADQLAHQVIVNGTQAHSEIVNLFGLEILNSQNEIDRKKLGQIVFNDVNKLQLLENIIHPKIQAEVAELKNEFEKKDFEIAFYDVPLLFEKNLENKFDAVLMVYCSREQQEARMRERDKLNDSEIQIRLNSQLDIEEKVKKSNFVIYNTGSLGELKLGLANTIQQLLAHQPHE